MNGELGWVSTAHVPYIRSRWAFSFHWAVNSSPMTAQVQSICRWQRVNLLLNNSGVCMWGTGPYQSSRRLIKVERGSGWIKDLLIKMSRENARPHFIYLLELSWGEKERGELWEKWGKRIKVRYPTSWSESDTRGNIVKQALCVFGNNQKCVVPWYPTISWFKGPTCVWVDREM